MIEGSSVDYDTLVIRILDSDKFTALIEQLSLQQGQALQDKLQQNLQVSRFLFIYYLEHKFFYIS